jgi:iron(III) transport system substrate-binding protein
MPMKFVLATVAAAFVAVSILPEAVWADDWATVLANARKEGVVVVHGTPGKSYNAASVAGFNKSYPDIKVQFSGVAGAAEVPKVIRERQAGIFEWDVWIGGSTSALGPLKESGFFQPLRPILRPEIMADDKWVNGFDAGWMDLEKKIYYSFDGTIQNPILVNWDFVKKDSLKSLLDLTTPAFAGKIVSHDPRVNGTGNGASQTLVANIGMDGLIAFYKNQVTYTTNGHQIAEWVVRGRYPIGMGFEPNELAEFQSQGLGKNISPLPDSFYKVQQISPGFGNVGFVDRAPHPNAAAVYINWLLSKEGQNEWVQVPRNSRRTDVPPMIPDLAPKLGQGITYFTGQAEEHTKMRQDLTQVAKDAIDGVASRTAAPK